MRSVAHRRRKSVWSAQFTLVLTQSTLATINCVHSTGAAIARFLRLATFARVVGSTLVNIGREDAGKVFLELFSLCEVKLLRFCVDTLPFSR